MLGEVISSILNSLYASETNSGLVVALFIFMLFVMLLFAVVEYVFKGIGLYVMARRQKNAHAFFAFIPFLSTILISELGGEVRFFQVKFKKFGIIAVCVEILYFLFFYLFDFYLYGGLSLEILNGASVAQITEFAKEISDTVNGSIVILLLTYISPIVNLVYMLSKILLLFTFFRKYSPNNDFLFTVVSVLVSPSAGIFIFVLRNKNAVDYNTYVREKMSKIYGMQYGNRNNPNGFGGGNYSGNPYGNRNGYNGGNGRENNDNSPFGDYNTDVRKPFSQFDAPQNNSDNTTKTEERHDGKDEKNKDKDDDLFN